MILATCINSSHAQGDGLPINDAETQAGNVHETISNQSAIAVQISDVNITANLSQNAYLNLSSSSEFGSNQRSIFITDDSIANSNITNNVAGSENSTTSDPSATQSANIISNLLDIQSRSPPTVDLIPDPTLNAHPTTKTPNLSRNPNPTVEAKSPTYSNTTEVSSVTREEKTNPVGETTFISSTPPQETTTGSNAADVHLSPDLTTDTSPTSTQSSTSTITNVDFIPSSSPIPSQSGSQAPSPSDSSNPSAIAGTFATNSIQCNKNDSNLITRYVVPDLHLTHYQYWLKNNPSTYRQYVDICSKIQLPVKIWDRQIFNSLHENVTYENIDCMQDLRCGNVILNTICSSINDIPKACWGYESCENIYLMPECYGSKMSQAKSEQEQKILWFNQADFGYILERRRELGRFCIADKQANHSLKSSFDCTRKFRTCRGENLLIDLRSKEDQSPDLGGWNCDLQEKRVAEEAGEQGELESWFDELKNYRSMSHPDTEQACDSRFEKQVFFVKLDSSRSLYEYLSSFFNLYATMHLNNKFFQDNQMIIWNAKDGASPSKYDNILWPAFTSNKPISLSELKGKRVCFEKFIFALPSRSVNGLYQKTPLVPGCKKTGLFDAFNKHMLHKLRIRRHYEPMLDSTSPRPIIRVVLLSRKRSSERRIVNEEELKGALMNQTGILSTVDLVDVTEKPNPLETIGLIANTDILIGMHGDALTYLLFLPDWSSVIELHDCGDRRYADLAKLRGLDYFKLDDSGTTDKSFTKVTRNLDDSESTLSDLQSNYSIKVNALIELVEKAVERSVRSRSKHFEKLGWKPLMKKTDLNELPDTGSSSIKAVIRTATREQRESESMLMNKMKHVASGEPKNEPDWQNSRDEL